MTTALFPQTLFITQHAFNDYGANDMRYGDLSEEQLKREFGLTTVSNVVDPYTLTRLTPFNNPQSRFAGAYGDAPRGGRIGVQACARLLFEEMQTASLPYSFTGPYRHLINKMLRHFQRSTGTPFKDMQLNAAYCQKVRSGSPSDNTLLRIQEAIGRYIDYENKGLPQERLTDIKFAVTQSILPMFDSFILDKINGMGIAVHGVYATKIEIIRLEVEERGWWARVKFTGQDHFGLDEEDIRKPEFNQFQFFKIWFVLQRFNQFGFRPFLTNMEAVVNIKGER